MDEKSLQTKLAELAQEIGNVPEDERAIMAALTLHAKDRHEKIRKTVSNLQDSIDYLRLTIKYLLFDLEATRRENGYLRKMLEDQSGEASA